MNKHKPYIEYFKIAPGNYLEKVKFYETQLKEIQLLSVYNRLEIELDYLLALFEIGKYKRYLNIAEEYIHLVIQENIIEFQGKDIYTTLLFKKAASLYNLSRFRESKFVLEELLKIKPENKNYRSLMLKCIRATLTKKQEIRRNLSLILFLVVVLALAVEILVIRSFYTRLSSAMETARILITLLACLILLYNEYTVRKELRLKINAIKTDKNKPTNTS